MKLTVKFDFGGGRGIRVGTFSEVGSDTAFEFAGEFLSSGLNPAPFRLPLGAGLKVYDPYVTDDVVPNQYHDLDEFLDAVNLVVIMVKHDQIRENADKLRGKIVLDCHNVIDLPRVYHI